MLIAGGGAGVSLLQVSHRPACGWQSSICQTAFLHTHSKPVTVERAPWRPLAPCIQPVGVENVGGLHCACRFRGVLLSNRSHFAERHVCCGRLAVARLDLCVGLLWARGRAVFGWPTGSPSTAFALVDCALYRFHAPIILCVCAAGFEAYRTVQVHPSHDLSTVACKMNVPDSHEIA